MLWKSSNFAYKTNVQVLAIFGFVFSVLCPAIAIGQSDLMGLDHVCESHPKQWHDHDGDAHLFRRVRFDGAGSSEPTVELVSVTKERIYGRNFHNGTCQDKEYSITKNESRTHMVTIAAQEQLAVEGNLEAFAAFFAKLKATARAQVTFDQSYTGTWEESIQISVDFTLHPCQQVYYQVWKNRYEATGSIVFWPHSGICACEHSADPSEPLENHHFFRWKCSCIAVPGAATGFDDEAEEFVQRGLVDPCPCGNVVDGTEHVLEPSGPPIPPADSGTDEIR